MVQNLLETKRRPTSEYKMNSGCNPDTNSIQKEIVVVRHLLQTKRWGALRAPPWPLAALPKCSDASRRTEMYPENAPPPIHRKATNAIHVSPRRPHRCIKGCIGGVGGAR